MADVDRIRVFIREVDYYSNPEVVVLVAKSVEQAERFYSVVSEIPHETLVKRPKGTFMVYQGVPNIMILRPEVMNRKAVDELDYEPLYQVGQPSDRFLSVFMQVRFSEVQYGPDRGDRARLPEVVVVTAADKEEADKAISLLTEDVADYFVRTTMGSDAWAIEGDLIEIDQSIRQIFVLRPPGNLDLR